MTKLRSGISLQLKAMLLLVIEVTMATADSGELGGSRPLAHSEALQDPLPIGAVQRLGTVRFRQGQMIVALSCSADGKSLFSYANGVHGSLHAWDPETGKAVNPPLELPRFSRCLRISPDENRALVVDRAGLHEWRCAPWRKVGEPFLISYQPNGIAFSADSRLLAMVGHRGLIHLVRTTARTQAMVPGQNNISAVACSPNGEIVASGDYPRNAPEAGTDCAVRLWNGHDGTPLGSLKGHRKGVSCLAFSSDGKHLASCSEDSIRLWDVYQRRQIWQRESSAASLAFSPDGSLLATAWRDSPVNIWRVATGKVVRNLPAFQQWIESLTFSPTGTLFTAGQHSIQAWDVARGTERLPFAAHHEAVFSVRFSPDGKRMATLGADNTLCLWAAQTGTLLYRRAVGKACLCRELSSLQKNSSSRLAFSADGKYVAALGTSDFSPPFHIVTVFETSCGQVYRRMKFEKYADHPSSLSFSPDSKILAVSATDAIRLWSLAANKVGKSFSFPTPAIPGRRGAPRSRGGYWVGFSPDERTLLIDEPPLRLLDWSTGVCLRVLPEGGYQTGCAIFSRDGSLLATTEMQLADNADKRRVQIWEAITGNLIRTLAPGTATYYAAAFSPDGRLLATAGSDSLVRVWNVATGEQLSAFAGHKGDVLSVHFSPDGKRLASSSIDSTALVWDLRGIRARLPTGDGTPAFLARSWQSLALRDASRAYAAVWALAAAPEKAVEFLKPRLRPAIMLDKQRVQQLIADLDSDEFTKRESATGELKKLGKTVELPLKQALAASSSEEARKRLQLILDAPLSTEDLQQRRAIVVLEQIGSPEARDLLKTLAAGGESHPLTHAAQLALKRLQRRNPKP